MKLSDIAKGMIKTILIIGLVCILVSIAYYRSLKFIPFLLGVILGIVASVVKVFLLDRAVDKALKMEKKQAGKYIYFQNLLRLFVSGLALIIAVLVPQINLWGVAIGVLAFPFASYGENFKTKKNF